MGLYDDRLADLSESAHSRQARARRPYAPRINAAQPHPHSARAESGRKPTAVQSLLFDRSSWTAGKAKAWAQSHGYRYGKVDVTDQYIRIRQSDPKGFKVKRTIPFGRGIRAVVAREESQSMATKVAASRRRRSRKKAAPKKRARRRRRVRAPAAVAAPRRRRRRRAKKVVARRRRRARRRTREVVVAAPRRRRRRKVRAWRGNSAGHATAARKGHRRRRARKAGRRRTSRRRRARESVMETPRRRRRRSRRRTREAPVVRARRSRRRYHRRHHRSLMEASRGGRGMAIAELGIAVVTGGLGFILADGVDRLLATYNPAGTGARPTNKFTSDGAGTLANTLNVAAKPSLIRVGAGIGMTALPAVGASMVRNPMARAAFEGMTVGAGVSLFKMLWNGLVMPMLAPKDTSTASLQKSFIVRLYPAEVAAHINAAQQQVSAASGVLSGAPGDVGPFALSGDSQYPDAAQALRNVTGVHGDSPYPSAAQALRNQAGMSAPAGHGTPGYPGVSEGWAPGPPPGFGPGPQPNKDCGCVGDPTVGFATFLGDAQEQDPLFNLG